MSRRRKVFVPKGVAPFTVCVALFLLATACATMPSPPPTAQSSDTIILLPDDQGKTGAIIVSGTGGDRILSEPRQAVTVTSGETPPEPFIMPRKEVDSLVGPALAALPKPPAQFILYFEHDTTQLTKESLAHLEEVVRTIREHAPADVSVVGHTDTMGTKRYNNRLSLKRARAVAALLSAKGVDLASLEITYHGEDNLLVPTGDQVPEPRNRRVEVTVR
ncbi:MAG TPA: OmpA family protein [Deltaproteobacteria bacterium]|nr:OmpA family protein [Deltaproteobacteria bacterium]